MHILRCTIRINSRRSEYNEPYAHVCVHVPYILYT